MVDNTYDVIIIGGGWSGLMVCKYCREEGLSVLLLEKRATIGGVWKFTCDPEIVSVQVNTCTTSSASLTEISDFPMPPEMGDFPHNTAIYRYLEMYADQFKLWNCIRFNENVKSIKKTDDNKIWSVKTDKLLFNSKCISICSGISHVPNRDIESTLLSNYTGEIIHGGHIKSVLRRFDGKNIAIIGGGETASDILEEWYPFANKICWIIPNGQHFFRKFSKFLPFGSAKILDKASSRAMNTVTPYVLGKPGLTWVCNWATSGSLLGYQGHGIPEFKSEIDFMHSIVNKNGHVLDLIDYNRVIPKSTIVKCVENCLYFEDGSHFKAHLVINATGYKSDLSFLPEKFRFNNIRDKYKHTVEATDTTLSFVGFVRPVVGSIPQVAEAQARFVSKVCSGKICLPNSQLLETEIKNDKLYWERFVQTTTIRKQNAIEGYTFLDEMAKITKTYPNYRALWKTSFREWYIAVFSPFNGASYNLNDENKKQQALKTLERHMKSSISPIQFLLIGFMKLIKFDLILKKLGEIKFRLQRSPMLKKLYGNHLFKWINKIWLMPKNAFFDKNVRPINIYFDGKNFLPYHQNSNMPQFKY